MASTKGDAILIALRDQLAARAGLAGVSIEDFPYNLDELGDEWIMLWGLEAAQGWSTLGNARRQENVTLKGTLRVQGPGADRAKARELRARAIALHAEIENQLRTDPTVNSTCRKYSATRYTLVQWADSDGRGVDIDFEIDFDATLPRS